MFYLKEFFKAIGDYPIRGIVFLFLSCLLAVSLTHRTHLAEMIEKITPEKMVHPYFIALADGKVNLMKLKKILLNMPGIISVDDTESQRSRLKISTLVEKLGEEYFLSEDLMNLSSMRIVMKQSLSFEGLESIRQNVVKLGGGDHIRTSDIKFPEITGVLNAHPFYDFVSRAGDWGMVGIIGLLWVISYWLSYDIFRSRAYIIEKFQRKNFVAAKTMASGMILVMIIGCGFGIWNETLKFVDTILLVMIFSFFWAFLLLEWRWKPTL